METKDVLTALRNRKGITQEALADSLAVTRQAVSRWERGETLPNPETLKQLSKMFDVSINTLLGSPRRLFCQCCGMPLEDENISREMDGSFNEDYCKWCYADGQFAYKTMDELVDFLVNHMSSDQWSKDQARTYFAGQLAQLKHWKA